MFCHAQKSSGYNTVLHIYIMYNVSILHYIYVYIYIYIIMNIWEYMGMFICIYIYIYMYAVLLRVVTKIDLLFY